MYFLSKKHYIYLFILVFSLPLYAKTPQFNDYPAQAYTGKNQPLKLDQKSRKYRTLFKELSQQRPNFAGHYVMETVGCGGGCSFVLAYNAKTGQSFILPHTFADCYSEKDGFTANGIRFMPHSRLVVATGSRYGKPEHCETVYYLVEPHQFKVIQSRKINKN